MSFEKLESLRCEEGLSVSRFCEWVGLPRSTYYYQRSQHFDESPQRESKTRLDPRLRERARELALAHPMYGYRKIWALLGEDRHRVSRTTVYRWLKEEGLLLAPKYHREARQGGKKARRKYLQPPQEINQLWQIDITWVDVGEYGMHYVTNVIDYVSRFPLASRFSHSQTTEDVVLALEDAVEEAKHLRGALPEEVILVSDNGSQFASNRFRRWIRDNGVGFRHIRGRPHHPQTTGMVERYHQSKKYEEVWLNDYDDPIEARQHIDRYRERYAYERPHQALDYGMPAELYITEETDETLRITA